MQQKMFYFLTKYSTAFLTPVIIYNDKFHLHFVILNTLATKIAGST